MKERIFTNWHTQRFIYLSIGLFFTVYAVIDKDWTALLPGLYFSSMAIFHFGCATGGCAIPQRTKYISKEEVQETVFEEIKNK